MSEEDLYVGGTENFAALVTSIDVNDTDFLWNEISLNNYSGVRAWIEAGGSIEDKNEDGNTPLTLSLRNKHTEIAKMLIEAGVDPNIAGKGDYTPLMCAISYGEPSEIFDLLLNNPSVDLDYQDKDGDTALIEAVNHGKGDMAFALLDKGADPYLCNWSGETVWDKAAKSTTADFIGALKKRIYPRYDRFTREGHETVSSFEKHMDGTMLKHMFNFQAQNMVTLVVSKEGEASIAESRQFHRVPRKFLTEAQQALKHMKGML